MDAIVIWSSFRLSSGEKPVRSPPRTTGKNSAPPHRYQELKVVLIDRHHTAHANPLDPLIQALHEGSSLIIFPEGTAVLSLCPLL